MTNLDKAVEVAIQVEHEVLTAASYVSPPAPHEYVQALHEAGLLVPAPQIIRTQEELEELDPDTLVIPADNGEPYYVKSLTGLHVITYFYVPAVVLVDGVQVRAAREALEEDNG